MKDIENMTKAELVAAFRNSGKGRFKILAHILGALKTLSYFSYFAVGYFAYFEVISWWWLAVCFGATSLLEYLTKSSFHAHLMKQGYDYYGVEGDRSKLDNDAFQNDYIKAVDNIISNFGAVMEECDWITKYYDVKILPHKKDEILKSLLIAYKLENDDDRKEVIKIGLLALTHFQKDIGETPFETIPYMTSTKLQSIRKTDKFTDEESEELKKSAIEFLERDEAIDKERAGVLNAIADAEYENYLKKIGV